jgi:hypothetical protein
MRLVAAVMLVLIGGCSGAADRQPDDGDSAVPPAGMLPAPHDHGNFQLTAQGLKVLDEEGGPRSVRFGTTRADAEQAAINLFGEAAAERSIISGCGAGPMEFTTWGPLTLNFQEERFVGWTIEHPGDVPTVDGAWTGLSRTELERARDVRLFEGSTLGDEFSYQAPGGGTIGGIFEGEGGDAIVALLYAGTTCFFR